MRVLKKISAKNKFKCLKSFTLAEVLVVLAIIGIVAAMTIPTLYQNYQEMQWAVGAKKAASTLQNAVNLWKNDIGCISSAYICMVQQNIADNDSSAFDQISKFMNIVDRVNVGYTYVKDWLPSQTLNYYGNSQTGTYGGVSNASTNTLRLLLLDGTTMAMDVNPTGFDVTLDVNGSRPPNREGKDVFRFLIGGSIGKDVWFYPGVTNAAYNNSLGLCGYNNNCNPNNTDPGVGNAASPTAYTILNGKIPDFSALHAKYPTTFAP